MASTLGDASTMNHRHRTAIVHRSALTLIELLVILAAVALLVASITPSLRAARDAALRRRCAANLKDLGQAMQIYAQAGGVFPMRAGVRSANDGAMRIFFPTDRGPFPPSTTGMPSPTVDLWMLIRGGTVTKHQFICPSTQDQPDPIHDVSAYYDFLTAAHLSYAYQFQHDPNRRAIGLCSEPLFPVMADANPYVKGDAFSAITNDRAAVWQGNSLNHSGRMGQNVLRVDGRVSFETSPDVGLAGTASPMLPNSRGRDNCYTTHQSGSEVDPGIALGFHTGAPTTLYANLGDQSDAVLIP